ncbi:MAG: DUF4097 family beta strand repeat-containing protein [Lachnospiraceae bacterium]|nr:DUF4097 family beta strand repeat-containing protein [Lachnospiraceae bacterium]
MEEYIKMLSEKLAKFSEETRNEILEDYKEHFQEGRAAGIPDEQIIADLGDIDEMVAGIIETPAVKETVTPEVEDNLLRPETVSTAAADNCSTIVVNGTTPGSIGYSAAIQVFPSNDGSIHAEYTREIITENSPKFGITVKNNSGVYAVDFVIEEMPEPQSKGLLARLFNNHFSLGVKDTGTIKVYVPQNFPVLTVKNSSGCTAVQGICVGSLSVSSSSGSNACDKIKANDVAIASSSGCNALSSISASMLAVQSSSGSSNVQSCLANSFGARSSSGSNIVMNVTASECTIISSSGGANAENITAHNITLTTSSGSSHLNGRANNINITSSSGGVNAHIEDHFSCINVKSGSGSINLSGYDVAHSVHNIFHGSGGVSVQAGEGEKLSSVVNINCGSGHISITE